MQSKRFLRLIHGWLGAISAFFIILVAVSGAMLAFVGDLFLLQHGDVLRSNPPAVEAEFTDIASLISAATTGYHSDFHTMGILMPHSRVEGVETTMVFGMPQGVDANDGVRMISVDPWTAEYKGDFALGKTFGHELIDFHHQLFFGEAGIAFVSILSLLLICFVITGIWMWWPRRGYVWRKASTLKLRGGVKNIVFTLHSFVGIWLTIFILYFSTTGIALAKPEWFGPFLSPQSFEPPKNIGFEKTCTGRITPGEAANLGAKVFPEKALSFFFLPNREGGPYMLTFKSDTDANKREGDATIYVHASCENVTHVEIASSLGWPKKITALLLSLHGGYSFGGILGKFLVLIAGLGLVGMAASGVFIFITRTLKVRKR